MENGHWNSGFTHWKWWIFPWLCKRLPEGNHQNGSAGNPEFVLYQDFEATKMKMQHNKMRLDLCVSLAVRRKRHISPTWNFVLKYIWVIHFLLCHHLFYIISYLLQSNEHWNDLDRYQSINFTISFISLFKFMSISYLFIMTWGYHIRTY